KGGPGFDPAGTVRNLLGLDDFSINGSGENGEGATVGVGKYIGDKIYLEVESGAGSGKASVEVEVTPNISVESVTGATGENSVGVNWKHDY
ncbi:MAG: translocation/assembly module TamB domain-containing protein, partial [Alphaproteobacteria bacterium]|nr:translocation/assembly module TamB domain-containing protein [Alphaproteobacteria bacterium]